MVIRLNIAVLVTMPRLANPAMSTPTLVDWLYPVKLLIFLSQSMPPATCNAPDPAPSASVKLSTSSLCDMSTITWSVPYQFSTLTPDESTSNLANHATDFSVLLSYKYPDIQSTLLKAPAAER